MVGKPINQLDPTGIMRWDGYFSLLKAQTVHPLFCPGLLEHCPFTTRGCSIKGHVNTYKMAFGIPNIDYQTVSMKQHVFENPRDARPRHTRKTTLGKDCSLFLGSRHLGKAKVQFSSYIWIQYFCRFR